MMGLILERRVGEHGFEMYYSDEAVIECDKPNQMLLRSIAMIIFLCCCADCFAQQPDTVRRYSSPSQAGVSISSAQSDKYNQILPRLNITTPQVHADSFAKKEAQWPMSGHIIKPARKAAAAYERNNEKSERLKLSGEDSVPRTGVLFGNPRFFRSGDSVWRYSGICKVLQRKVLTGSHAAAWLKPPKPSFFAVHGNVQYDFLYRSYQDTPFYQKDFRQHSVRTNIHFLIRKQLPLQVTILHRNSNSPYFRDITDVSLQFYQRDYFNRIREELLQQATRNLKANYTIEFGKTKLAYDNLLSRAEAIQNWLSSPARLQELVTEKERLLKAGLSLAADDTSFTQRHRFDSIQQKLNGLPGMAELPSDEDIRKAIREKLKGNLSRASDSVLSIANTIMAEKKKRIADSLQTQRIAGLIDLKKKELEDLRKQITQFERRLKEGHKKLADSISRVRQELTSLKDAAALKGYIQKKKSEVKNIPKNWKVLSAIRSAGFGRTWLDYSELTVKNISLTGGNFELNPGNFYMAVAAGRVNYRFRDFVVNNAHQPRQSLYLLRIGYGRKEGNNIILTWYDGKRNLINAASASGGASVPERVIGFSAEARLRLNEHQSVVAEFAKSSFHTTYPSSQGTHSLFEKVKNFRDRSNEAYSIKLNSYWPQAGARITGYYRKSGAHFQSFNLQPVNSEQEAYQLKYQQHLWKRQLAVDAAIRKNDFANPFLNPGVSSRTVFKSVQASLRIPKWPFVSIGYSPSTQLTVAEGQRLIENQYNTLNVLLSYSYKAKSVRMVTNAMYLKFFNNARDTGFIYYNASSFSFTHLVYLKSLQLQSGITLTKQQSLSIFGAEQSLTWQIGSSFFLTGGVKYSSAKQMGGNWGSNAGVSLLVARLGTIQLNYDKSFFPGTQRNLLPMETGRLTYIKVF